MKIEMISYWSFIKSQNWHVYRQVKQQNHSRIIRLLFNILEKHNDNQLQAHALMEENILQIQFNQSLENII